MRHWRVTLLLLLIALPLQLVAGQFASCPHDHEAATHTNAQHSHGHHQHDHHHGSSGVQSFTGEHHICPDCDTGTLQITDNTQFHCDHCQCCHLAISPAITSTSLASPIKQPDHWVDT